MSIDTMENTSPTPEANPVAPMPEQNTPTPTSPKKPFFLFAVIGVLLLAAIGGGAYYMGAQQNTDAPIPTPSPQTVITPSPSPTANEGTMCTMDAKKCPDGSFVGRQGPNCEFAACPGEKTTLAPTKVPPHSRQPVIVPSNWKSYTVKDWQFGTTTTMYMPPGYSFAFSGSEYLIQNDSDATEIWDMITSVNSQKNTYTNGSRRTWYQDYLEGDFLEEKPADFEAASILSAQEKFAGNISYYEMTVSKGTLGNRVGASGTHYLYAQNGIIHVIVPTSDKAVSSNAKIPEYIPIMFTSLKSTYQKP